MHVVVRPHFLPLDEAIRTQKDILSLPEDAWDRYDNPFERKWTLREKTLDIFDTLTSDAFIADMEQTFGCSLIRDEHKLYWGIHVFGDGDFLAMHLDAGVHPIQKLKKHVTVGVYLSTQGWSDDNAGHLVFSDGTTVAPTFNTFVAFENTIDAWHGSPTPVTCHADEKRIFVTVSFLSRDPLVNTREKAYFSYDCERNYLKRRLAEERAHSTMYKGVYRWNKKVVVTITGIRPDFIRMSELFKKFDEHFFHVLIHTGQHYDPLLSDAFFYERAPDFVLEAGRKSTNHYEQLSYLSVAIPKLFEEQGLSPDLIVFLGDSNTVGVSFPLKKQGYKVCHIEAGMRSGDRRMLEEINRTVCDHCSDIHFVYHEAYRENLERENIRNNVFVVGNTIVEVARRFQCTGPKRRDMILMDIHRPENFNDPDRLRTIVRFAQDCYERYKCPIKLLFFKRLMDSLERFSVDLGHITVSPLMSQKEYLETVYHARFLISDSGTGQEEPALFGTRVLVPRDFTERPQSYAAQCSFRLRLDPLNSSDAFEWIEKEHPMDTTWLGNGTTSEQVVTHVKGFLS
jgi:UDP-N-acetylglucosamine 2-epimerase (non-hydrolysing)